MQKVNNDMVWLQYLKCSQRETDHGIISVSQRALAQSVVLPSITFGAE